MEAPTTSPNIVSAYQQVIDAVPDAWAALRKHRHRFTADINNENIDSFSKDEKKNLESVQARLAARKYLFSEMRPINLVQKGKKRQVLISTVEDRIVSKAILDTITPWLNAYNSQRDFSRKVSRPRDITFNGVPLAALAVQRHIESGYHWVLEADIKKFFDNVPKDKILAKISGDIVDTELMALVENIVKFKIAKEGSEEEYTQPYNGLAQGSSISPLLASVYLHDFDEHIKTFKNVKLVRYVDDFIILCKDEKSANEMYKVALDKLKELGLDMHEKDVADEKGKIKTRVLDSKSGPFDFLGLRFNYLDIDISEGKKKDLLSGVQEVLHKSPGNFYDKILVIERKMRGFVRQYRHPHYTRTKQSLNALASKVQAEIESDYLNEFRGVFGKDYLTALTPVQQKKLLGILGAPISKMVK